MSRRASGLWAWLLQRVSALYLALFLVWFIPRVGFGEPMDYAQWSAWIGGPWVSVAVLLFFAALIAHAWVGVRNVLIDYVRVFALRLPLLMLLALGLGASGIWALQVILLARMG